MRVYKLPCSLQNLRFVPLLSQNLAMFHCSPIFTPLKLLRDTQDALKFSCLITLMRDHYAEYTELKILSSTFSASENCEYLLT